MEKKSKCSFFRDEFNWGNCGFHHSAPEEFVKSQVNILEELEDVIDSILE